jgi:hypothetical protein
MEVFFFFFFEICHGEKSLFVSFSFLMNLMIKIMKLEGNTCTYTIFA